MTSQLRGISVYRIRDDRLAAAGATDEPMLGAVLRGDGEPVVIYRGVVPGSGHRLALAVAPRREGRPRWCDILQPAFSTSFAQITASSVAAVLLVQPPSAPTPAFVIAFGSGRHLLDPDAVEPNFGLRVALNAISGPAANGADWSAERIRSVDVKRVASNTISTRRQASRHTAFEDFDVDVQRDLVRSVTGVPVDGDWGNRISGSDACRLVRPVALADLGGLCEGLEEFFHQVHYRAHFAWIDHVRHVVDARTRKGLDDAVVRALRVPPGTLNDVTNLELAPPDLLDWDAVEGFGFSTRPEETTDDVTLAHFRQLLQADGALGALNLEDLKRHTVVAYLNDSDPRSWPVYRCLSGEIRLRGKTYLLDCGQYYEVSQDYLADLDAFIVDIPRRRGPMPGWRGYLPAPIDRPEREEDYNKYATEKLRAAVLLDRRTIRIDSRTSPVEVCDILTAAGELIHVKPKRNSSVLSHLFAQGAVSADLLLKSQQFRERALGEVEQAVSSRSAALDANDAELLTSTLRDPLNPRKLRIVYAIVAKWQNKSLAAVLPFFSKVNLRAHVEELRAMGYVVEYAPIEHSADSNMASRPRRRRRQAIDSVAE